MSGVFESCAAHLRMAQLAKKKSKRRFFGLLGPKKGRHAAFREVAGSQLDPGVPPVGLSTRQAVEYRKTHAYDSASKVAMQVLFPNGKADLTFVPESLREYTWNVFQEDVFPELFPLLTNLILRPVTMQKMMEKGLTKSIESLKRKRMGLNLPRTGAPFPQQPDDLNQTSKQLLNASLDMMMLPLGMKKIIRKISLDLMSETMGESTREVVHDSYIHEMLELSLNELAEEAASPSPPLSEKERKKKLNHLTRELVDECLFYLWAVFTSSWRVLQNEVDAGIHQVFGMRGIRIKNFLDKIGRFVFFKIIGNTLFFLYSHTLGKCFKLVLFHYLKINRDNFLDLVTKFPEDQGKDEKYVVFNEDLLFKVTKKIKNGIDAALQQESGIPVST